MIITAALTMALGAVTPMQDLSQKYLTALWAYSPTTASAVGWHQGGVDQKLDDLSPEARKQRLDWLTKFNEALQRAKPADEEEASDRRLLEDAVALERLELAEAHDYARRCDRPLDDLGSVFFNMVAREYAPRERRAADVAARLGQVKRYLEGARRGLGFDVPVFREAARDDGEGLIDYLQHGVAGAFDGTPAAAQVKTGVAGALEAVRAYLAFVDGELTKMPKASHRYGAALYAKRFGPYLQTRRTPDEVLAAAERRAAELHAHMKELAKRVVPSGDVREALRKIADDHARPEALFETARKDLDEARAFVAAHKLLTLPARDNLQVIETPPFLRSQLGVAAFDGAPPLQPQLGAFYYVTPFPKDWPREKVDAKLREYNRYMLALITIHEAMPGHYVQFEHANAVKPDGRRVLRWILGANSYIEGWAVYTQDVMVEAGFWGRDPRLALQQDKLELRAVTNAILDIRLHTRDLPDEDALKLMIEGAFQERPEAELKLRRAKLSVTQLCSYFVGGETWRTLRRDAEARAKAAGKPFDARAFHDWALGEGAVTLDRLEQMAATHTF